MLLSDLINIFYCDSSDLVNQLFLDILPAWFGVYSHISIYLRNKHWICSLIVTYLTVVVQDTVTIIFQ